MLSVLIVNWNTRTALSACLASIKAHPPQQAYEVIVVDNASADGSAESVRVDFPEFTLIEAGSNTGYARGNNLAFSHATGDLLLALNPDTEVFDDTFARAISAVEREERVAAIGARLIGSDGGTQRSVRGFPTLVGIFGDITGLAYLFPRSGLGSYRLPAFDYDTPGPAPQPMGSFLLFRREALEAVGDARAPFDPEFPIFFNEVDLLYRLFEAGWTCRYEPGVRALHRGGESTKLVRKSMIWESHRSLVRFFRKHRGTLVHTWALVIATPLIYAAAFIRARGYDRGFRA